MNSFYFISLYTARGMTIETITPRIKSHKETEEEETLDVEKRRKHRATQCVGSGLL